MIEVKLSCRELKAEDSEAVLKPGGSGGSLGATATTSVLSSIPWCSTAYRDDVRSFLDKTVCG